MLHKQKYQTIKKSTFQGGMTLDQYLNSMETFQNYEQEEKKFQQDLYETCRDKGESQFNCVGTFQIKEINEDEEQEQYGQPLISKISFQKHQNSLIENPVTKSRFSKQLTQSTENITDKKELSKSKSKFQVKCLSKSPWPDKKGQKVCIVKHSSFSQTVRLSNKQKVSNGEKCVSGGQTIYGQFRKPQKVKQIDADKVRKIKMTDILRKTGHKIHYYVRTTSMSLQNKIKENVSKNPLNLPQIGGIRTRGITDKIDDRKKKKSGKNTW